MSEIPCEKCKVCLKLAEEWRIIAERQRQGIIQKDLAAKCRLSEGAIMRLENGRPVSTKTLEKVCNALGIMLKAEPLQNFTK